MTAVTALPWGRPLTRDDLDRMPEDGHRYELLDGMLLVSPAPHWRHQRAVVELVVLLRERRPPGTEVLTAPVDVVLADDTVLQPDVLVAWRGDLEGHRDLPAAPLLAVEVLSPSTRRVDLLLKHSRYEAAGVAAYWTVDVDEPAVHAWVLRDGVFVSAGSAVGEEVLELAEPFAVSVVPHRLVTDDDG